MEGNSFARRALGAMPSTPDDVVFLAAVLVAFFSGALLLDWIRRIRDVGAQKQRHDAQMTTLSKGFGHLEQLPQQLNDIFTGLGELHGKAGAAVEQFNIMSKRVEDIGQAVEHVHKHQHQDFDVKKPSQTQTPKALDSADASELLEAIRTIQQTLNAGVFGTSPTAKPHRPDENVARLQAQVDNLYSRCESLEGQNHALAQNLEAANAMKTKIEDDANEETKKYWQWLLDNEVPKNRDHQDNMMDLGTKMDLVCKRKDELEHANDELREELDRAKNSAKISAEALQNHHVDTTLRARNEELRAQVTQTEETVRRLEEELKKQQRLVEEHEHAKIELREEMERAKNSAKISAAALQNRDMDATLRAQNEKLRSQVTQTEETVRSLEEKLKKQRRLVEEQELAQKRLKEEMDINETRIMELEANLALDQADADETETEQKQLNEEMEKHVTKIKELEDKLSSAQQDENDIRDKVEQQSSEIETLKTDMEQKLDHQLSAIRELETNLSSARDKQNKMEQESKDHLSEIDRLEHDLSQAQNDLGQLEEENKRLSEFEQFARRSMATDKEFIGHLKERAEEEKSKAAKSQTERDALTKEVNEKEAQIEELTAERVENKRQVDKLTDRVDELTSQLDELNSQVSDLTTEKDDLNTQKDDLTTQRDNLTTQRDNLTSQVNDLASQIGSLEEQKQNLEVELREHNQAEEGEHQAEKHVEAPQDELSGDSEEHENDPQPQVAELATPNAQSEITSEEPWVEVASPDGTAGSATSATAPASIVGETVSDENLTTDDTGNADAKEDAISVTDSPVTPIPGFNGESETKNSWADEVEQAGTSFDPGMQSFAAKTASLPDALSSTDSPVQNNPDTPTPEPRSAFEGNENNDAPDATAPSSDTKPQEGIPSPAPGHVMGYCKNCKTDVELETFKAPDGTPTPNWIKHLNEAKCKPRSSNPPSRPQSSGGPASAKKSPRGPHGFFNSSPRPAFTRSNWTAGPLTSTPAAYSPAGRHESAGDSHGSSFGRGSRSAEVRGRGSQPPSPADGRDRGLEPPSSADNSLRGPQNFSNNRHGGANGGGGMEFGNWKKSQSGDDAR